MNANWGIYIKCLEIGETVALNADQQMDNMSVIKIRLPGVLRNPRREIYSRNSRNCISHVWSVVLTWAYGAI